MDVTIVSSRRKKTMNNKPYEVKSKYAIVERWRPYYNKTNPRYPCKIKGCKNKLRNGRCGLDEAKLEVDINHNYTGKCLSFTPRDEEP
jgi:hypothetical protein